MPYTSAERMPGIPIIGKTTQLRYAANAAAKAWLEDRENVEKKRAFARSLRDWAEITKNRARIEQAERLLRETEVTS